MILNLAHLSDADALYVALLAINRNPNQPEPNAWDNTREARGRIAEATEYTLIEDAIAKVTISLFNGDRALAAELRAHCLDSGELPSQQLRNVGRGWPSWPARLDVHAQISAELSQAGL